MLPQSILSLFTTLIVGTNALQPTHKTDHRPQQKPLHDKQHEATPDPKDQTQWQPCPSQHESCPKTHLATRYSKSRTNQPITFSTSPLDPVSLPRVEPMNATASEQWEFDGVSSDGTQSFIFGFYRDPNYSFLGTGNLRVYFEMGFANGSRYAVVDYAESSTVEECSCASGFAESENDMGQGDVVTRGTWRGRDFFYEFEITGDMKLARVRMENPEVNVSVVMNSGGVSPLRFADNAIWPAKDADLVTVPHFYWVEPMPVADVVFDIVVQGEAIRWSGMGGHERLWAAFNWYTCLASMLAVRIKVGPFALSFVEFGSGLEDELVVPSVLLAHEGRKVFATRRTEPSRTEDFVQMRKLYGGEGVTTEMLADKVTGIELVLESPGEGKKWRFVLEHKNVGFEYFLGEGVGGTGYSGLARGGLVGSGEEWAGPAFSEVMRFPKKSWLLNKNYV